MDFSEPNTVEHQNGLKHVLHCLLGMKTDHLIWRNGVGNEFVECKFIITTLAEE